jgi:hypothetical protein
MTSTGNKRKRKKLGVILFSPVLVFSFIIGWCLYIIGDKSVKTAKKDAVPQSLTKKDDVGLSAIPFQEQAVHAK